MRLIDATPLEEGGYKLERRRIHNGCEVIEGMSVSCVPTVDAEPVRHGKWTHEDCHAMTYKYCCSNCKAHHRAMYDYCPSCGARMDGQR